MEANMKRFWIAILLLIMVTVCIAGTTGKLAGRVKDESGKGVAYVNIVVFAEGNRITGVQSKENGTYMIINVPPGVYELRFILVGYVDYIVDNVKVNVDQTTTLNAILSKKSIVLGPMRVTAKQTGENKDTSGSQKTIIMDSLGDTAVSYATGIVALQAGSSMVGGEPPIMGYIPPGTSPEKIQDMGCIYIRNCPPPPPPPIYTTDDFASVVENNYKYALAEPLSTFSIDVDTACYTTLRRNIESRRLPLKNYVRIEELLNYFDYDYPQPKDEHPFSFFTELGICPWNSKHQLMHIGLQGKTIDLKDAPPSNLVYLIDVSGSMNSANKLPLVQESLKLLVKQMRPEDRVAIVVYAGAAGLVLPSTSGNNKAVILEALDRLRAGGSTAGGAGILLAYKTAKENFLPKGNNRVILCTDGDFNTGASSNAAMEELIVEKRKEGVFLTVLGYGMGNYKDSKMEILADKGNGNYAYIDNLLEANKVLVRQMSGTLFNIAKDVKFQLEFNPAKVKAYRLIGYENRILNKEDFNDDTKDAGELGSGHTVTALYEIIPADSDENIKDVDPLKYQTVQLTDTATQSQDLLTVKLRYKKPDEDKSILMEKPVKYKLIPDAELSENFRFSAAVAEYGLLLKDSEYKGTADWKQTIELARSSQGEDKDGYRKEFITLSELARDLSAVTPPKPQDNLIKE
jgi:Ca-activated chloride channel family protein